MGTMVVVLVIVAVVVVGVVVAKIAWRPEDEVGSVESYHRALGTIEHLAMGNAAPVRAAPDGPRAASRDPSPYRDRSGPDPVWRSAADGSDGAPRRDDGPTAPDERSADPLDDPRPGTKEHPLVFDDAALTEDPLPAGGDAVAAGLRSNRARRAAMASMDHRSRRRSGTAAIAAAVVLVVAAVAVYEGSRHHTSVIAARRTASAGGSPAVRHPGSTTRVRPARSRHTGTTHHKGSTSTTPAAPTQLVATSSSPAAAVYPTPTGAYQVTLAATGPCWVDATATSTGSTVWTGTMEAGQTQVLPATGPLVVEIGSTAATLSMNGEPVVLPTPLQAPFVATFEPAAAS